MADRPLAVLATGQHDCFDERGSRMDCAGSGQDGEVQSGLAWPEPRFIVDGEIALDRLTGLYWPCNASLSELPLMWQESLDFVAQMNTAVALGYDDWRLPTRRELMSVLCYQQTRPPLPTGHPFINLFAGWYWSATTAVYQPAYAWYMDLDGGRVFYGGKDQSYMVWPVRGESRLLFPGQRACFNSTGDRINCAGSGQDGERYSLGELPQLRFVAQGKVVMDHWSGLEWLACADLTDGPISWGEAFVVVAGLEGERNRPWRLPNINELESLVDYDHARPALPPGLPLRDLRDGYWSSTTSAYEPDWAWALYPDKGAIGVGQKKGRHFYVMAVR